MNSWLEPLGYTSSFRAVRAPRRLTYEHDDNRQKPKKPWKSTRMETRSNGSSVDRKSLSMELRPKSFSTPINPYPGRRNDTRSHTVPQEVPKSYNYHRTPKEIDYRRGNGSRCLSVSREVPKIQTESRHARRGYSVPPSSKRSYSDQKQKEPKTDSGPKKSYSRRGNDSRSQSVAREAPKPRSETRHDRRGYSVPPSSKRSYSDQKQKGKNDQRKRCSTPFKETTRNYSSRAPRPQTSRIPLIPDTPRIPNRSQYQKGANYEDRKTPTRATSRGPTSSRSEPKGGYSHKRYVDSHSEPTRRSERIANMRARESGKMDFHLKGPRDVRCDSNKPKGRRNTPRRPRGSSPIGSCFKRKPKYFRRINWFPLVAFYQYPFAPKDDRPDFAGREDGCGRDDWATHRPRPPTPLPGRMFPEPEAEYFRLNDRFPMITFEFPPSASPARPTDCEGRKHGPQSPRPPPPPIGSHYEPRAKYGRKSDRPPQNEYPRSYVPKPSRSAEYRDSGDLYNRPGCSSWDDERLLGPSPVNSPPPPEPDNFQENDLYQQPPSIFDRFSTNSSESEREGDRNRPNSMDRSPMDQASTSYGSDDNNFYNPMNRKHLDEPSTSYDSDQSHFFGRNRGPMGGGFWPNYHYPESEISSPMRVNPSNIPPPWTFLYPGGFYPHNFNDDVWDEPYLRRPEHYSPSQHSRRDAYEDFHPYSNRQDSFQTEEDFPRPATRDEAERDSTRAPSVDSIPTIQVPESPEVPIDVVSNASIKRKEPSEVTHINPTTVLKQESSEVPDVNLKIVPKQEFSEGPDVNLDNALSRARESAQVLNVRPSNSSRQDVETGSPEAGNFRQSNPSIEGNERESSEMPGVNPSRTPQQENTERSIMPFQLLYGGYALRENTERSIMPFQGLYGESNGTAYVDQGMGPYQGYYGVSDAYSRLAETMSHILELIDDNYITPEVLGNLSEFLQEDEGRGFIVNLTVQNGFVSATRKIRFPDGSIVYVKHNLVYTKNRSN